MYHRYVIVTVVAVLPIRAVAGQPRPTVNQAINRGLTFLAKDSLTWRETKKCAECHHAPFTVWALGEAKRRGHAVDEKVLVDLTSWALARDLPARQPPKDKPIELNQAPLMLALGVEAADVIDSQDGLKKLLRSLLADQGEDGSWKLSYEFRPIGSSPETLTTLALMALSAPNVPDLGEPGKAAREKALAWLRSAKGDEEPQAAALQLILWRRLGLPATDWEPLAKRIRSAQNADGGWGQTTGAKSDAYGTGQALYALAEAGLAPSDEALLKGQSFLMKSQREDGSWAMVSRAIMRDGKPPKNLAPITHAGSAWAVLGLVRSTPAVARRDNHPVK